MYGQDFANKANESGAKLCHPFSNVEFQEVYPAYLSLRNMDEDNDEPIIIDLQVINFIVLFIGIITYHEPLFVA